MFFLGVKVVKNSHLFQKLCIALQCLLVSMVTLFIYKPFLHHHALRAQCFILVRMSDGVERLRVWGRRPSWDDVGMHPTFLLNFLSQKQVDRISFEENYGNSTTTSRVGIEQFKLHDVSLYRFSRSTVGLTIRCLKIHGNNQNSSISMIYYKE